MTDRWGVYVDECAINGNSGGAEFWADTWMRMDRLGRATLLDHMAPPGGLWHVRFGETKDDAEFALQHMISKGIHPRCVKVMTLDAARKLVRRRHKTRYTPGHSCRFCREEAAA